MLQYGQVGVDGWEYDVCDYKGWHIFAQSPGKHLIYLYLKSFSKVMKGF